MKHQTFYSSWMVALGFILLLDLRLLSRRLRAGSRASWQPKRSGNAESSLRRSSGRWKQGVIFVWLLKGRAAAGAVQF